MNEEFLLKLERALDGPTRKRLVAYAYQLVSKLTWPGELSLTELAEDIASEAVCKIVAGDRKWNPESTPILLDFVFSAVKSTVDARLKNVRNKLKLESADAPEASVLASSTHQDLTGIEAEELLCALIVELGDDRVCVEVMALCERGYKPQEIAKELGLDDEKEVYAAKKRLQRAATTCLQRMNKVTEHAK